MPWEIDNALLTFTQLKKSYYYIPKDANVTIETVLNLSTKFIDWDKSVLPKDFFISKYNDISILLKDYNHIKRIYDGDEIYGFLNLQRECISEETDYYIGVCPDMYFDEQLLAFLIESTRLVKNEYFVITAQTYKRWDSSWDETTNAKFINIPYNEWDNFDLFKTRHILKNTSEEILLIPVTKNKWAWWFDLYNKKFYENLCPVQNDWKGYGPWDWYSMMLSGYAKLVGVDFQQYMLKGQTLLDYNSGYLKDMTFMSYYKKYLTLLPEHTSPIQRENFYNNMNEYINKGIQQLKDKNIICTT